MTLQQILASLRPASFKGVAFDYLSDTATFEQRYVTHEFPQRNAAYHEPLGAAAQSFEVEAILIGPAARNTLERLTAACVEPRPGTLVHARYGERYVTCMSCRVKQSATELGVIRLQLQFAEEIDNIYPLQQVSVASAVLVGLTTARRLLRAAFVAVYVIRNWRQYVLEAAALAIGGIAEGLFGVPLSLSLAIGGEVEALISQTRSLRAELAGNPEALAGSIGSIFARIVETEAGWPHDFTDAEARRAIDALGAIVVPDTPISGTTDGQRQLAAASDAIGDYVRQLAIVTRCALSQFVEFQSYDDAIAMREALTAEIDSEILAAGDVYHDDVVSALVGMRAAVVESLTSRGASLRPLASVVPTQTAPALLLAYQLYGEERDGAGRLALDRADDIVFRNRVRHPGFVPGAVPLEVVAPEDAFSLREGAL